MIQLNTNPIEGSALRLSLAFRDASGTYFVPLSVSYTLLALNLDKESWSVVGDIYQKEVTPESMVNLVIPNIQMISGTTPKRKLLVTYYAMVDGQETSFIDEACFEVKPMPYVPDKPLPPPTPSVFVKILDVIFQTGSAASAPLTPVFYCKTNLPVSIAGASAYISGSDLAEPIPCSMSVDSTCTTVTVTCGTELRHSSTYILNVDNLESTSGLPMEKPFTLSFVTEKGQDPSQLVKEVSYDDNGEYVVNPDEGYSSMDKVLVNVNVPLQENKDITITENGSIEVLPDEDYKAFEKITLTTSIPIQQFKAVEYNDSGDYEVEPDEGYTAVKKVAVKVDVQGKLQPVARLTASHNGSYDILPTEGMVGMKKAEVFVDVPLQQKATTITSEGVYEVTPDENYDGITKNTITVDIPLQQNKDVTVVHNGSSVITPDTGYDGMEQVSLNVNVPLQATKTQTFTDNGSYTITPDVGYDGVQEVGVNVNVPMSSNSITLTENNTTTTIVPESGMRGMTSVDVTTNIPMQSKEESYSHNGIYTVTPDTGYEGLSDVQVEVAIPFQDNKVIGDDYTHNGVYEITPDEPYEVMKKVTFEIAVSSPNLQEVKNVAINLNGTTEILPDDGYDAIRKVIVNTEMSEVAMFAYMGDNDVIYYFASPLGITGRYMGIADPTQFNLGFAPIHVTAEGNQYSIMWQGEEVFLTRDSEDDIPRTISTSGDGNSISSGSDSLEG